MSIVWHFQNQNCLHWGTRTNLLRSYDTILGISLLGMYTNHDSGIREDNQCILWNTTFKMPDTKRNIVMAKKIPTSCQFQKAKWIWGVCSCSRSSLCPESFALKIKAISLEPCKVLKSDKSVWETSNKFMHLCFHKLITTIISKKAPF